MRASLIGLLLVCLVGETAAVAEEHPIRDAGLRAVARLDSQGTTAGTQADRLAPATPPGGHPVLIGVIIGGGAGAVLGAVGSSCSTDPSPFDAAPCGTHPRVLGALLGGAIGSGVGALIGFAVKAIRN